MKVVFIIIASLSTFFLTISLIGYAVLRRRLNNAKSWKVGDVIRLKNYSDYVILSAWSKDGIFIQNDNNTEKHEWNKLEYNKSDIWRKYYQNCKEAMGKEIPAFDPKIYNYCQNNQIPKYNGKSIELLTEIECQIYLNECLKKEDYENAELIRKQLEKYR